MPTLYEKPIMHSEQNRVPGDQPSLTLLGLWTVKEAANYLKVSERYLRDSCCPRRHLPGKGPKGQPLVRFIPSEVEAWANKWRRDGGSDQDGTSRRKAA